MAERTPWPQTQLLCGHSKASCLNQPCGWRKSKRPSNVQRRSNVRRLRCSKGGAAALLDCPAFSQPMKGVDRGALRQATNCQPAAFPISKWASDRL